MSSLSGLTGYWWVIPILVALAGYKLVLRGFLGMVMIPEDSLGIVNKKFALFGKTRLPDGAILALNGEAGVQADPLAPGVHFFLFPWQFEVTKVKFTNVSEGKVGVVEARGGTPLTGGRVLAKMVECGSFQDTRAFLTKGGERGPQIAIIPPGTYRINTALFTVEFANALEIKDNMVGVVTTKDGKPLPTGEIAGGEISGHNMFQDGESFIAAGGYKGLQEQVILAGRYYINPRFATVEEKPMTAVPIAHAGVVIAYVGKETADVTGESFKHGNLFAKGSRGVCVDPIDPGKYPINPYTHKVELVPTANVVLNWADGKNEAHNLDKNLCTIKVRSSDGFTFNLDVSQIIHIPRTDAPKVIARFGSVGNLVTQVLEPTIGNYFRNAAQKSDVIDFLNNRSERQNEAKTAIQKALMEYNVGAIDTLIGDITPPEALMKTLTDRKIAQQEKLTFKTQQEAEEGRKELQQARAVADTQAQVVASQRKVEIAEFDAQSAVKQAEGAAKAKTINAKADAEVLTTVGDAEGKKVKAVGEAEAEVIRKKTEATGQNNFALMQLGEALSKSGHDLVPRIVVTGGGKDEGGVGGGLVQALIGSMLSRQVDGTAATASAATPGGTNGRGATVPAPAAV